MREDYYWSLFGLFFILFWAWFWMQQKKARDSQAMKRREMLHAERLKAIEQGVPLPELPDSEEHLNQLFDPEVEAAHARWMLRASLLLGLVSVATGVGLCLAFRFSPDRDLYKMWTIGIIPLLGGVGFLIFWAVAANRGDTG